jgi:hypothetical protein
VSIAYDHENGALVAYHVADGVVHKHVSTNKLSASAVHHHNTKSTSTYEHIRGVIRSVDLQGGTLTIVYGERI